MFIYKAKQQKQKKNKRNKLGNAVLKAYERHIQKYKREREKIQKQNPIASTSTIDRPTNNISV